MVAFAGTHNYPGPYCNGLVRLDRTGSAAWVLERGREFFRPRRRGFVIWTRTGADDDLAGLCRASGFHERPPREGMPIVARTNRLAHDAVSDVARTEIDSPEAANDYLAIVADAYGMSEAPVELQQAIFFTPAAVLAPTAVGLLLQAEGRPATGAMAILADGVACVLWVATSHWARGRGLGRAGMWAITEAAFSRGATLVVAQSSQMGLPHWTGLGFDLIGHYHRFLAR
jgi:hypothetical protein